MLDCKRMMHLGILFFIWFKAVFVLSSDDVHPLDLVVLIDGSMNVGEDSFNKELNFVRKLFNRFPITSDGVHVALAVTSDSGLVAFSLKEHLDNSSVNAAIDKLTYPGGAANVGKALTKVRGWVFGNSARNNVPKVLVSLLQGTASDDVKRPSSELQADGIKIVSIGVMADRIQVNSISSIALFEDMIEFLYNDEVKLNNVVTAINEAVGVHSGVVTDDLDEVNGSRISLDSSQHSDSRHHSNKIGGVTMNEETSRPLEPVDLAFVIDGSEGVGKEDFEHILKFLNKFIKQFPIAETMTRVAVATISDEGRVDFDFSHNQAPESIAQGIRLVAYPAGKMNAGKALKKVNEEIFQRDIRSGTAQVLVIIMKDKSLDDVKDITADMRENRIKIISIATSKVHHDVDASSSISFYKDNVNELSNEATQKQLYQKIKQQAVLKT